MERDVVADRRFIGCKPGSHSRSPAVSGGTGVGKIEAKSDVSDNISASILIHGPNSEYLGC